jgi:hypothetical protein
MFRQAGAREVHARHGWEQARELQTPQPEWRAAASQERRTTIEVAGQM